MAQGIPARLTAAQGRRFGLTVGAAFLVLAALLWWRGHVLAGQLAAAVGALLGVSGLAVPDRLGPIYRAWMGLALALSRVTTPVFMAILYFLVLTPIGLLRRLFGGNPLTTNHRPQSAWVPRTSPRGDLERQF